MNPSTKRSQVPPLPEKIISPSFTATPVDGFALTPSGKRSRAALPTFQLQGLLLQRPRTPYRQIINFSKQTNEAIKKPLFSHSERLFDFKRDCHSRQSQIKLAVYSIFYRCLIPDRACHSSSKSHTLSTSARGNCGYMGRLKIRGINSSVTGR